MSDDGQMQARTPLEAAGEDRIRADEREACADVAEEAVGDDGLLYNDGPMIAAAIRARSA